MIEAFIKSMLGPLAPLLDYLLANPVPTSGILLLWLGIYLAGRFQLQKIEQNTKDLVLQLSQEYLVQKPHLTAKGLYQLIYPRWSEAISGWGWFIPHRFDLWPVPVTAHNVAQKITFSPQWIVKVLAE